MRKTLAFYSLTCCNGCKLEAIGHFDSFQKLLNFYDVFEFSSDNEAIAPSNVSIIEGNPSGKEQENLLRRIRKHSEVIIALGACANIGGLQSIRNNLPKKLINKDRVKAVPEIIKVDYTIPGCPINHQELYDCLMDIYWGKTFVLPQLPVCFECRKNENGCLIKDKKPCLGPITRSGCNSVCVNNGGSCLGCRGQISQPNINKINEILEPMIGEKRTKDIVNLYGENIKEIQKK
jgi:sulfhydrogenase subunit delta